MAPNLEHVKRAPYSSEEPRTGSVTSFNVIQNNICMGAALGSQYRAMTEAAEILKAQLHSHCGLTVAWNKNQKIQYENEF
jgi:hypothetical protein